MGVVPHIYSLAVKIPFATWDRIALRKLSPVSYTNLGCHFHWTICMIKVWMTIFFLGLWTVGHRIRLNMESIDVKVKAVNEYKGHWTFKF